MSRVVSLNEELQVDGKVIHLLKRQEFSEGEEGLIEVADGSVKYKIRDLIFSQGEIEIAVNIKGDKTDLNILDEWVKSGLTKDAFLVCRGADGSAVLTYLMKECELSFGKLSAFDRKSKTENTKTFKLMPRKVERI